MKINEIIQIMADKHAVQLGVFDRSFLAHCIDNRIRQCDLSNRKEYAEVLHASHIEAKELASALNVSYSEFFRDPISFALLEKMLLPSILRSKLESKRNTIRLWSAGCAAGQEAYSAAILLQDLLDRQQMSFSYHIVATDISEKCLVSAQDGIFNAQAVGNVPLRYLQAYFIQKGENYQVRPEIQSKIDFSRYDLLNERFTSPPAAIFGGFDLVFCANVLIYYKQETRNFILKRVHGALASSGFLLSGEAERSFLEKSGGFTAVAALAPIFRKIQSGEL